MKAYLFYLGCRVNQSEVEGIASKLREIGYDIVDSPEEAELIVFNTCAVTKEAERKSRQYIRRLRRANPKARLVVTGCYAELVGEGLVELGADVVLGNKEKAKIVGGNFSSFFPIEERLSYHSRPFVKVQDGCDANCSYCIIRVLRGKSLSRPVQEVVAEVQKLISLGYDEITIVGVHLGSYGRDIGSSLKELVENLLRIKNLKLLRFGSIEPFDITDDFIELYRRFDNLAPHLHLPLQSGSDRILSLMRRPYNSQKYLELVAKLREIRDDFNITTDIMVGFPTESEEDFLETVEMIEKVNFGRVHLFSYSPRKGTDAFALPRVPEEVIEKRMGVLKNKAAESALKFNRNFLGKALDALILENGKALLPHYVEVLLSGDIPKKRWVKVLIERASPSGLSGRVL
ncbi:MAG: MiaB/RimO family radical SAM methylthiotransferase [Synergistetes bacterium]|nr:MAG: MiaB-like tRNA modifying enzyme [bacterium 42_11]MBC7331399.1 MiaB/RimO family radical SAM methylthiotransferase [Synergistota bacterium]MDK2872122.1 threonylcarbamoyladenosine tRNA methylthiotransferase MtaB [bacterium]